MATDIEYALMAGRAYFDTRADINRFPVPQGWTEKLHETKSSGFEAIYFQRGNEIVISFAGTATGVDWFANSGLATGFGADQLRDAAAYFMEIRQANPTATTSFTGHSLGGGLAALMGVMFGYPATTFDAAPFRLAARTGIRDDLIGYLRSLNYSSADLERWAVGLVDFTGLAERESNVTGLYVQGEALQYLPFSTIGGQAVLAHGTPDYLLAVDLHSQALLSAFLQNVDFRNVTFKLPDLIRLVFDSDLYQRDVGPGNTDKENLIERLVRHQAGNIGGVPIDGDKMLDRFTTDLQAIAQDGGLTLTNNNITKALVAFAMQMYYDKTTVDNKQFFDVANVGGSLHFDRADVVASLKDAKGDKYFQSYVNANFTPAERILINSMLPVLRDWYVQAGTSALNTADTQNRNAFLLGGKDSDGLVGGSGADLLVGNGGADLLQGKIGNDILLGGAGNDTYVYTTGDGLDTILDSADQNTLAVDGDLLSGGAQYGDALVHRSGDGKHLYVRPDANTLLIDGNLLIRNYASGGSFGFSFADAVADTDPQTTRTIQGDLTPVDADPDHQQPDGQVHGWTDDLGNIAVSTAAMLSRADILYDDTGNERIESGGGNDVIYAIRGGDNLIDAGSGRDMAYGGVDKDVLIGGADGDILYGGAGADRIYGATQTDLASAIAEGRTQTGSGQQGDWLAGAAGDDTLIGGAANDVLSGGGGTDLLIGGAGDDDLFGDTDWVATDLAWSVTDQPDERLYTPVAGTEFPADGAADVIYAGAGNDHAWSGIGNDAIFGETGDDSLAGEDGNDIILGGVGKDIIEGDGGNASDSTKGNDYLDGGEENDTIWGNGGDDILIGGKGDDTLRGGAGRDTYLFNKGDGIDEIWDDDTGPEKSILIFGAGFDKNTIKLRQGSLLLDLGEGDAIHIENFDPDHPLDTQSFASFQFADGSSLTWNELLARGFDLDGTDGDDTIIGTGVDDRISGLAGNDLIWALDGNDILTGGTGTDGLNGGLGDDTYIFNAGDSSTLVTEIDGQRVEQAEALLDAGGTDTVRFAADVDAANLTLTANPDGALVIDYHAAGQPLDRLLIVDGQDGRIEKFEFVQTVGAGDTARNLSYTQFVGEYGNGLYAGTDAAGHLHLTGGNTDDSLYTAAGSATVSGGRGNDLLRVYGTTNTLHYSVGDGTDLVQTSASANAGNVVKLSGVTADELSLYLGPNRELVLRVGADAADALQFSTFNPGDVDATPAFERIEFDDGSTLTYDELLAKGFAVSGTAEADLLMGTNVDDRISGGAGDDLQMGGGGNDTYRFNAGDGQDVIQDAEGVNTVQFGAGLTAQTLSVSQSLAEDGQRYLDLDFGNGDRLSIMEGELDRVASFAFADGTPWSTRQVLALLPMVNLRGGDGDEVLAGFGGNDLIDGGAGNDVVTGGDGADRLYGGLGNDMLQGDAGADVLDGGAGNDALAGGSGVDTYRFGAGMGQDSVIETGRLTGNPFGDALVARSRRCWDGDLACANGEWRIAA